MDKFYDKKDAGGTPSDSVRYILANRNTSESQITGELNILDIEPCYDSMNGYSLQESYIRMMIPKFRGTINITHMTTAEFIGSTEDLNSTYNMIFMGLDQGAYNTKYAWMDGKNGIYTYWNDSWMDGKIYFHTGDKVSGRWNNNNSVRFLWFGSSSATQDKEYPDLRFPGNDITTIKKTELSNFLSAGYPIVAVPYLYDADKIRIDQHSNICTFINEEKTKGSTLYRTDDSFSIEKVVKRSQTDIEWLELPNIYDGSTSAETAASLSDPNYLDVNTKTGRNLLPFKFKVKDDLDHQYKYRIYIDQNRDGKFDQDEIFYDGKIFHASDGEQGKQLQISKLFVGFIQWKIEVYRTDNGQIRFTKMGCSASKNSTGNKIEINVLQIEPDNCNLNLKENELFIKYYDNLSDYKINVTTMKRREYQDYFTEKNKFEFDYSKDICTDEGPNKNPISISKKQKELYDKYNMIIIGFQDTYGGEDFNNEYGAVDFLKYFAAKGKSILFTHDITSMNNVKDGSGTVFGYTANKLMRDFMGMNRYKAVHKDLSSNEREKLQAYQTKHQYDTVTDLNGKALDELQGLTYYTIKRLGTGNKMPYSALVGNGFNINKDLTIKATKTNEGQITQYPYKIGEWTTDSAGNQVFDDSKLPIAVTHGQWYQLDMEDPEITVWYCLTSDYSDAFTSWKKDHSSDRPGDSTTYGVSPNDAANNYYIYSKGNIFYSGVGHSTVTGDMEAKLFINTIIGAYRVSYEPPIVEILNSEAEITDNTNLTYLMTFNQEYDESGNVENLYQTQVDMANVGDGTDTNDKLEKVMFSPVEMNAVSTKLSMSAYYLDEETNERTYITTIYHVRDDGTPEKLTTNAGKNYVFDENINSMDKYYFYYPKACLNEKWTENNGTVHTKPRNVIKFEVKNNKVKESGYTKLNMQMRELFMLD